MLKRLLRKKSIDSILSTAGQDAEGRLALSRVLTARDITAIGIAAIIGAGIFSSIGRSCFYGGPAVVILFVIVAVTCAFSALCYAEFASRIPASGSAYTYSYAVFGEFIAWIIGWDLILEYAIGNITVAIAWSSNLTAFLQGFGISVPAFLTSGFMEASKAHTEFMRLTEQQLAIPESIAALSTLWETAPRLGGVPVILNIPAFIGVALITALVYIGVRETRNTTLFMVAFKVIVILLVIFVGSFYVTPSNWTPFMPNGFTGVMSGVSAVFFAYIGFDAIATTAEECKNPNRDLPRGIIYSLLICTVLYIAVAIVLTGMVNYSSLNVSDFLASAFKSAGLNWFGGMLALSAVIATTGVMLVFQFGQPRIWMVMSRDGLMPRKFGAVHPRFRTPAFATIVMGILVGVPSLVLDAELATDMNSIGTLFAFILVCGGILFIPKSDAAGKFKVPYMSGKFMLPLIILSVLAGIYIYDNTTISAFFDLNAEGGLWERLPMLVFAAICAALLVATWVKNLSLIPVLGVLSCLYLMTELGIQNWMRFLIWLIIGLIIYFLYGINHSKLVHRS